MASFEEIIERFLKPKALSENLDHSTWTDESMVWIRSSSEEKDPGASVFLSGSLHQQSQTEVAVKLFNGQIVKTTAEAVFPANTARYDRYEDLAQMGELNEACVLNNLKQRYLSNLIYTYSGLFLIAINPYRNVPVYAENCIQWYRGQRRGERPPHIFSVADGAYQALLASRKSQSILITGESGAGKTENTKRVIQYLTAISSTSKADTQEHSLERQLILTNPILEAFGNAQTVRNNNSSRFGKFIRIEFDPASGGIVGASIEKYLLEKSRVTHRSANERSFHIFYQLLAGGSEALLTELKLWRNGKQPTPKDFNYTAQSNWMVEGVSDAQDFQSLQESLGIVGINAVEALEYFKILAVILLLGNLEIDEQGEEDQALLPQSQDTLVADICELLGVDERGFRTALLNPVIRAGKEIVSQARGREQVKQSIEALSRTLYERLFSHLIDQLNALLFPAKHHPQQQQQQPSAKGRNSSSRPFIGVLDIAGFEIFEKNSFEQLLINYTNEKLQQFFNHHMFIQEQEEYARQSIGWSFVDFGLDSQPMIDLLEKSNPVGILACLDEDCLMPKATDRSFTSKIQQLARAQNTGKFEVNRLNAQDHFSLQHYAGKVEYSTEGWLEKNKDPLNENLTQLLAESTKLHLLPEMFLRVESGNLEEFGGGLKFGGGRGGMFRTVAQRHRESLNSLMNQLISTQPHFVRCILPNVQKLPALLDDFLILEQLHCNGVLEGIRICRQGFPNRLTYTDFWRLYSLLHSAVPSKAAALQDPKSVKGFLMDVMGWQEESDFALGKEKVFFRSGKLGKLDALRDARLAESLRQLQAACRGALVRAARDLKSRQADSARLLQASLRPYLALKRNLWCRLISRVRPLLQVTRAENQIRDLQAQLKQAQQEREVQVGQLRTALAEERDTLAVIQTQWSEGERTRRSLQTSLQDREDTLKTTQESLARLKQDLEAAQARLSHLEREKSTTSLQLQEQQATIEALEREREGLVERLRIMENEAQALEAQIQQSSGDARLQRGEFESSLNALQLERESVKSSLLMAEEQISVLQTALNEAQVAAEQAQRDHRNQLRNLQQSQDQNRQLLEEQVEALQRKSSRESEVLKVELETERKSVKNLKEAIKSYESGSNQAEVEKTRTQQTFKREKDRLELRIREMTRLRDEAQEREDLCQADLQMAQSNQRVLKNTINDLEDQLAQVQGQNIALEGKASNLQEGHRELHQEKSRLEQCFAQLRSELEERTGQLEEAQDALLSLKEQAECFEKVKKLLENEVEAVQGTCARLTEERAALQEEVERLRQNPGNVSMTQGSSAHLTKVIERLEADCQERQNLLRENRRLDRELRDALDALSDRDQNLLQIQDALGRAELRSRKLQTTLEENEAALSEAERGKRRLTTQLTEEQERIERLQRDCERLRLNNLRCHENTASATLQHTNSCSSVSSRITSTQEEF